MPTVKTTVIKITADVRVLSDKLTLKAGFCSTVAFRGLYHSARIMEPSAELQPRQSGIQTLEIVSADPIAQGWHVGAEFKMCVGPDNMLAEAKVLTMECFVVDVP